MEYNGGRTENDIVNWILKRVGPPSSEVDCETLKAKAADTKLAVAYFGDFEGKEFKEVFLDAAQNPTVSEKFQFFHVADKECGASFGASSSPSLVLFRQFDTPTVLYSGNWETTPVIDWMVAQSVPTLIEFSEDYIDPIFGQRKPALFLFRSSSDAQSSFSKVFEEAASELRGQILFVVSGVTDGIQQRLGEFIGVDESQLPTIRLLDPANNMKKFTFPDKIDKLSVEGLKSFIADFNNGNLQPFLKSEEIPEDNGQALQVIVGKNFKQAVLDSDDDVFVKYYAPWCGHCKKLAPVWEELANEFKDVKGLKIAKFDATANEVEGVDIKGYPTLKFYPRGHKNDPVDYDGGRDLDALKDFIKEKSAAYKEHSGAKEDL